MPERIHDDELRTALLLQGYKVEVKNIPDWGSKSLRVTAHAPPGCYFNRWQIASVSNFESEQDAWRWLAKDAGLIDV